MEKTQTEPDSDKSRRILIAACSLVLFAGAVFLVSTLTFHQTKKTAPKAAKPEPIVATVQITPTGFEPGTLSVKQGTKITWTNTDQTLHQIVANPYPNGSSLRNLKSEILNNLQTYTYTAGTVGSFGYHDQLHPTTNGTLVVEKN